MYGLPNQDTPAAERMKAYIDAHMHEQLSAKVLADAAGYSQFHAARIFKRRFGRTPFEYIRERRLVHAAVTLRTSKRKVVDVAFDFMFDSHEGFTRAFTNAFGLAPKRFASVQEPSDWRIQFRVLNRQMQEREASKMSKETAVIFTQIVERPERTLLLRRSASAKDYFDFCEEFGCSNAGTDTSNPWDILVGIREALYEPVGMWLPENMRPAGTGIYAQGVELPADYSGVIPNGFDVIELMPCEMLVFQGEPYNDDAYKDSIDAMWERIAGFNPEVYGIEYADELAPRMQLAPMGWRGYIEMRPIREK